MKEKEQTMTEQYPFPENHPAHMQPTDYCTDDFCGGWVLVHEAADVTEEILDYAETWAEDDQDSAGRIDWETVFDRRLEGMRLADNRRVSLGSEYDTPAQRKIQREVRKRFREG
jgi:hypothetical protein